MQFRLHYSEFTFAVVVCGLTVNQELGTRLGEMEQHLTL